MPNTSLYATLLEFQMSVHVSCYRINLSSREILEAKLVYNGCCAVIPPLVLESFYQTRDVCMCLLSHVCFGQQSTFKIANAFLWHIRTSLSSNRTACTIQFKLMAVNINMSSLFAHLALITINVSLSTLS